MAILIVSQIIGGVMNHSYAEVFTKYNHDVKAIQVQSDTLCALIKPHLENLTTPVNILIDTLFAYLQFGLKPSNIYRPYGKLDKQNFVFEEWNQKPHTFAFTPKDFIILKKDSPFFHPKNLQYDQNLQESIKTLHELESGKLPFKKIIDTDTFVVFQNTDTNHTNLKDK